MALDKDKLKRQKKGGGEKPEGEEKEPVSTPLDKVVDFAFNASREKLREVTIIDRLQGRLLPQLDLESMAWGSVFAIAEYRQNPELYAKNHPENPIPLPPDLIGEFIYRTAQWQKSVAGQNLKSAIDIALAEMETREPPDEFAKKVDPWDKD